MHCPAIWLELPKAYANLGARPAALAHTAARPRPPPVISFTHYPELGALPRASPLDFVPSTAVSTDLYLAPLLRKVPSRLSLGPISLTLLRTGRHPDHSSVTFHSLRPSPLSPLLPESSLERIKTSFSRAVINNDHYLFDTHLCTFLGPGVQRRLPVFLLLLVFLFSASILFLVLSSFGPVPLPLDLVPSELDESVEATSGSANSFDLSREYQPEKAISCISFRSRRPRRGAGQ